MGYKESKEILADKIVSFIAPFRARYKEILADPRELKVILKNGGEKARERAMLKMNVVREKTGLIM